MGEIFVIVEQRQGEIREITYEMLWKADELCRTLSCSLTAILFCADRGPFVDEIRSRADRVIVQEDNRLEHCIGDTCREIIVRLIEERRPVMTLLGHTARGMDMGPALAVRTGFPLATDCVDILVEDGRPKAIRQIYTGKIFSKIAFAESAGYLFTIRAGAFPQDRAGERQGEVVDMEMPSDLPEERRQFLEYVDTGAGDVDITQADLLVSIGRGITEEENIATMKSLADIMGGVLACSRPVVDKNWLPKYHQVGTSGKTVKPKVYLALGISGAFQHVAGIGGAGTVIAVNKDKKAPIFRVADYGVVEDLFKIVDALKEKIG